MHKCIWDLAAVRFLIRSKQDVTVPVSSRFSKRKEKEENSPHDWRKGDHFLSLLFRLTSLKHFPVPFHHCLYFYFDMAPVGPLARLVAQLVVPLVAVLARAIPAAYGQALQNARKAGVDAAEASAPVFGKRISRSEALQVLNLTEKEAANPEAIQKVRRT